MIGPSGMRWDLWQDRKGRALSFDDLKHYQCVVKILSETDRIMQTIELTLKGEEYGAG